MLILLLNDTFLSCVPTECLWPCSVIVLSDPDKSMPNFPALTESTSTYHTPPLPTKGCFLEEREKAGVRSLRLSSHFLLTLHAQVPQGAKDGRLKEKGFHARADRPDDRTDGL